MIHAMILKEICEWNTDFETKNLEVYLVMWIPFVLARVPFLYVLILWEILLVSAKI